MRRSCGAYPVVGFFRIRHLRTVSTPLTTSNSGRSQSPATGSPEVTVVIPTRSRWTLLSTNALPAALRQEDVDLEVVVVDDGSVDETPAKLAELADPRLRVVRFETSQGVARARNAGVVAANGMWVAFLDDDDIWSPRKLRTQLDTGSRPDISFVYAAAAAVDESRFCLYTLPPPDPDELKTGLLSRNIMWGGCSNVVARTDLVRELGGFDEKLFQLCDWDLWIRLAQAGRGAASDEVLVGCLHHSQNMLLTSAPDVFEEFDYLVSKHRTLTQALGVDLDRALFIRWVAVGHRRAGRRLQAVRLYLRGVRGEHDLGNIPRALAALFGERWVNYARALRSAVKRPAASVEVIRAEPSWLALYR
jgi:glycosyltransferase involved in cell wall biosynthesis